MNRLVWGMLVIALVACGRAPVAEPDVITVAIPTGPAMLDPRRGADEASQRVHALLFNTLLRLDEHLALVPQLAAALEQPDERSYVVRLRQGVRFHDGRELTAEDVGYTFTSFLDPAFVPAPKGAYRLLAAVEPLGRYTARFRLRAPFAAFPINPVTGIVPAGAGDTVARHPIGTGPYRFVRAVPEDRVGLTRFDDYFEGPALHADLVLRVVRDDTMRGLGLRRGTVDLVINNLPPDIVRQLQRERRLRVETAPGGDFAYLGLNLRDPVLADRRVRQAIARAIAREDIVTYLRPGLGVPGIGFLPPVSWAFEPDVPRYPYDPGAARRLLDAAGSRGPDGDHSAPRFRFSLKTSTGEFARLQAAVIERNLRDMGIEVAVRSYEFATFYDDVLRGNFFRCTPSSGWA